MKNYHYLTNKKGMLIRIRAKRRPSVYTMPKSCTWVVYEYIKGEWVMPCFPEIVWETLKKFEYLGSSEII